MSDQSQHDAAEDPTEDAREESPAEAPQASEDHEPSRHEQAQGLDEELKVEINRDKLAEWDEVRNDYSSDAEADPARPIFTDEG